jgi:hypothetical protein
VSADVAAIPSLRADFPIAGAGGAGRNSAWARGGGG